MLEPVGMCRPTSHFCDLGPPYVRNPDSSARYWPDNTDHLPDRGVGRFADEKLHGFLLQERGRTQSCGRAAEGTSYVQKDESVRQKIVGFHQQGHWHRRCQQS